MGAPFLIAFYQYYYGDYTTNKQDMIDYIRVQLDDITVENNEFYDSCAFGDLGNIINVTNSVFSNNIVHETYASEEEDAIDFPPGGLMCSFLPWLVNR